jgi:hypothetical protein
MKSTKYNFVYVSCQMRGGVSSQLWRNRKTNRLVWVIL